METAKSFPITKRMVWNAYKKVRANNGGAGVDGVELQDFEVKLADNLYQLWNRLASGSYFPPPVREVEIPKDGGKIRKLGIPTVADRIAQMVVKEYLEPKVDPHFSVNSFGYRPGVSAFQALEQARQNCWKKAWVVDLDIQNFFDEIDHELLMKALSKHTNEKWVLMYAQRWMQASIVKANGEKQERKRGTPQGGVISPLLANLFLHYVFDKWMEKCFPYIPFERYADDAIIHCNTQRQATDILKRVEERLRECGLQLSLEKSKIVYCKCSHHLENYSRVSFDYLGYTFKPRLARRQNGQIFVGYNPAISKKSLKKMSDKLRALNIHRYSWTTLNQLAELLNPIVRGWINYYTRYRPSSMICFFMRLHQRLIKWIMKKYKHLRTSKRKALRWLELQAARTPTLFAHWRAGFLPTRIRLQVRRAV